MITIGILTFHRAYNYGAVMQAYALLTTLKNMGHKAEIINYWPTYRSGNYKLVDFKKPPIKKIFSVSYVKSVIEKILQFPSRWRRYFKFNNFIKQSLKVTNTLYQHGSDIPDKYDVIICGSDQIWRYNFRGIGRFDDVYFGKYPLNKEVIKIAYAASMGDKDIGEDAKTLFSKLIENLSFISVREDSLLNLVKPLTTKVPVQVLDPVFLIAEPEWRIMIKKKAYKKKYLLLYQLIENTEAANLAKKIAADRQLEIIQITGTNGNAASSETGTLNLSAGPVDFISLIAHADYIVSTSYHGIAFSVIFQKPFAALGFPDNCYRIKSLLKSLGIEHCLIEKDVNNYPAAIDYTSVNVQLQEMKKNSLSFLSDCIKH